MDEQGVVDFPTLLGIAPPSMKEYVKKASVSCVIRKLHRLKKFREKKSI